jgi:predicted ester cyclase
MDITKSKQLARDIFERGFGRGELGVVDAGLAPDAVDRHAFAPDEPDMRHHLKNAIGMLRGAIPDLRVTVADLFGEGDRIAVRVEMRGTHTGGSLFGVPPNGEQVEFEQFHIVQLGEDGLGIRHWANVGVEQFLLTAATRTEPASSR